MMRLITVTPPHKRKINVVLSPADVLRKEQAKAARQKLELTMLQQLTAVGLTGGMVRQYKPIPGRRFAVDFAWPGRLLLEVQGGTWSAGPSGHTSGAGIERDTEKLNLCTILGYYTMQVTASQIRSGVAVKWVERFFARGEDVEELAL